MVDTRQRILRFVRGFHRKHGYAPTYREIAQHLGRSLGGTHYTLTIMEGEGLILKDDRIPRSIRVAR